jgi:hypothetical protein
VRLDAVEESQGKAFPLRIVQSFVNEAFDGRPGNRGVEIVLKEHLQGNFTGAGTISDHDCRLTQRVSSRVAIRRGFTIAGWIVLRCGAPVR